jgi:hypothetical protein
MSVTFLVDAIPGSMPFRPGFHARLIIQSQKSKAARSALTSAPKSTRPATSPSTAASNDPDDREQHNGSNSGVDDQRHDANTKMDVQSWQQPITDEGSDNTHYEVPDETEPTTGDQPPGEPASDNADQYYDEKALVR